MFRGHVSQGPGLLKQIWLTVLCQQMEANVVMSLVPLHYGPGDLLVVVNENKDGK